MALHSYTPSQFVVVLVKWIHLFVCKIVLFRSFQALLVPTLLISSIPPGHCKADYGAPQFHSSSKNTAETVATVLLLGKIMLY